MPASRLRLVPLAATALMLVVGAAPAAAKAVYPSASSTSPKRPAIGKNLTIKGKNFRPGKNKNTVVFQRSGKPAVFVKAGSATKTKGFTSTSDSPIIEPAAKPGASAGSGAAAALSA